MNTEQENNIRWAAKNNDVKVSIGRTSAVAYFTDEDAAQNFIADVEEYVTIKSSEITKENDEIKVVIQVRA